MVLTVDIARLLMRFIPHHTWPGQQRHNYDYLGFSHVNTRISYTKIKFVLAAILNTRYDLVQWIAMREGFVGAHDQRRLNTKQNYR
jgi:hypothetical protein